ncbi:unnamed protein product, partial [Ectocarpus sp. 8 AP-2014]
DARENAPQGRGADDIRADPVGGGRNVLVKVELYCGLGLVVVKTFVSRTQYVCRSTGLPQQHVRRCAATALLWTRTAWAPRQDSKFVSSNPPSLSRIRSTVCMF